MSKHNSTFRCRKRQGFAPVIVLLVIVGMITLGVSGYFLQKNRQGIPSVSVSPSVSPAPISSPVPTASQSTSPSSSQSPEKRETETGKMCVRGGCSGEICQQADTPPAISICIYQTEFACYPTARCEAQGNGQCGWTQTPQLTACLREARKTPMPTSSGTPNPSLTPPTPSPTPTPSKTPTPSPLPPAVTELTIEADDRGFYPGSLPVFLSGTRVIITFVVRTTNVYYGGLDFRSSKFSSVAALPGGKATVEFTVDSSFVITSYWPASGVKKADLDIIKIDRY